MGTEFRLLMAVMGTAAAMLAVGCAAIRTDWTDDVVSEKSGATYATPPVESGSAGLDIAFVSVIPDKTLNPATLATSRPSESAEDPAGKTNTAKADSIEAMWRWVDETAVDPDVRNQLRLNGIRVGRVHTQSEFYRSIGAIRRVPSDPSAKFLASASIGSDVLQTSRREMCRLGKRYELPVRPPGAGQVATLVSIGGRTIGKTLEMPQPMFAMWLQSTDNRGVRIKLQPEIQYGAMKQTWVTSDSALRIDNRRDQWSMPELAFQMDAGPEAILVAGAMTPPHGLGQQMFTGMTADGDVDHVLMLIRVAQLPDILANR